MIISISPFPVLSKSAHRWSEKVYFTWGWMSGSEGWVQGGGRQNGEMILIGKKKRKERTPLE